MQNRFRYWVILAVVLVIAGLVILKERTSLERKTASLPRETAALVDSSPSPSREQDKAIRQNAPEITAKPPSVQTTTTNDSTSLVPKKLPVVIDLGRGTCIPCKMMLPILQELQEEYKGRAIIKIIDIRYEPEPARFYKIRLIPTQIFFDASGNEVYRHEGFMHKQSIKTKFAEMGVY